VSLNCTLPVAVDGVMVAVNVIDCPNIDGFCDEETVIVVVMSWLTFSPPPAPKAVKNPIGATIDPDNRIQTSEIPNIFFNDYTHVLLLITIRQNFSVRFMSKVNVFQNRS